MRIADAYLIRNLTTLPNGTIQAERSDTVSFIERPPNVAQNETLMARVHYVLEDGDTDRPPAIRATVIDSHGTACGSGMSALYESPDGSRERTANVVLQATLKERGRYTLGVSLLPFSDTDGGVATAYSVTFAVR